MRLRTSCLGIHHRIEILSWSGDALEALLYPLFDFTPDLDDQPMFLIIREESFEIIFIHLIGFDISYPELLFFFLRDFHIQDIDGRPG